MHLDDIEHIEINSVDEFVLHFALRTARADIIDYTITGCDLRGPAMTQVVRKRTWSRVTYLDCELDEAARHHISGTGGVVTNSTT